MEQNLKLKKNDGAPIQIELYIDALLEVAFISFLTILISLLLSML